MARIAFVLATLAVMAVCALAIRSAPVWPSVYSVHASFHVPYFNTKVPLEVHYDARKGREFVSYYHGMDTYIYRFDTGKLYSIFPRIDTPTCQTAPLQSGQDSYVDILPKLDSKWIYKGLHSNGQQIMWEWTDVKYNFTNVYQFFVARHDNSPLRLHMRGFNFVFGSHPDEYVIHYSNYKPNHVDEKVFEIPPLCQFSAYASLTLKHRAYAMTNMLGMNMIAAAGAPALPVGSIHEKFVGFMSAHKKAYANTAELSRRMSIFSSNLEMIEAHNRRSDVTYKLGVTQFTDMEMEEIHRVMIPNKYRRMQGHRPQPTNAVRIHTRGTDALPESVNWVEKGVVNPPKDQGSCGSCWTFGTAGSLEGAWAIKTGQLLSLSEQQILDCAWFPNGNSGCDGGFAGEAFTWISSNQGIATEADYPYLMADGYCKARIRDSGVRANGHVNVSASEEALMDAVANNGPVAVAINAATPDFYYMQGPGVYNNPACIGGIDDLDHEVLVVGYGTDHINGKAVPYWLLKNSWGIIWGDKGFWKMARNSQQNGGMCGIHQQGRYAIV